MSNPTFAKDYPPAPVNGQGAAVVSEPLRTQLNALGFTNYTTDEAYPLNPQNGVHRINAFDPANVRLQIYLNGAWQTVFQHLEAPYALSKKIATFSIAAATWNVVHNFGSPALVQVFDPAWNMLIPLNVQQVLSGFPLAYNTVTITHAGLQTGNVIVIG
jgi:hypothetical protein